MMGERDFAGPGLLASTDECGHRGRVMRSTEGAPVRQLAIGEMAGDRKHHRDLQQLARIERRQDRGQAARQHRLAGAGRPVHQEIVAAGGCDLEDALGALLAFDVAQVGQRPALTGDGGLRPRHHLRALEMVGELDQRARRDDIQIAGRPGRFRPAGGGADQPLPSAIGCDRGRQHPGNRGDRAVEGEFAKYGVAGERVSRDRADRRHDPQRDRQIVMAAFLRQVGRGEVDRDALGRQRQPRRDQRGTDALLALADRLVRQADEDEGDATRRDLDLHIDGARLDAFERYRRDPRHHSKPTPAPRSDASGSAPGLQEHMGNLQTPSHVRCERSTAARGRAHGDTAHQDAHRRVTMPITDLGAAPSQSRRKPSSNPAAAVGTCSRWTSTGSQSMGWRLRSTAGCS